LHTAGYTLPDCADVAWTQPTTVVYRIDRGLGVCRPNGASRAWPESAVAVTAGRCDWLDCHLAGRLLPRTGTSRVAWACFVVGKLAVRVEPDPLRSVAHPRGAGRHVRAEVCSGQIFLLHPSRAVCRACTRGGWPGDSAAGYYRFSSGSFSGNTMVLSAAGTTGCEETRLVGTETGSGVRNSPRARLHLPIVRSGNSWRLQQSAVSNAVRRKLARCQPSMYLYGVSPIV